MNTLAKPRALKDGLIITPRRGELMVFDLENHLSHLLNNTAALVWRLSDGETTLEEMIAAARRTLRGAATPAKILVALRQLKHAKLIDRLSLLDLEPRGGGPNNGNSSERLMEQVIFVRTVDCDVKRRARRLAKGAGRRRASTNPPARRESSAFAGGQAHLTGAGALRRRSEPRR